MSADATGEPLFSEDTLRADVAVRWGDYSAHIDVLDRIIIKATEADALRTVLQQGVKLLRTTYGSKEGFAHEAQMWVLAAEQALDDSGEGDAK